MRKQVLLLVLIILLISVMNIPNTITTRSLRINLYATRTIDGDPSDWIGVPPSSDNSYTYSNGEWIWKDAVNDIQDVYTSNLLSDVDKADITEIRITSNGTHLLLLIKFADLSALGLDGEPAVFITIDEDHTTSSGEIWFDTSTSETMVAQSGEANWERQIAIYLSSQEVSNGKPIYGDGSKFVSGGGGGPLDIYDENYKDVSTNSSVFVASTSYDVIEAAISWSDLGIDPSIYFSGGNYLRIEVCTVAVDSSGNIYEDPDPGSSPYSDAVDVMSTQDTVTEISDDHVDYYVDVQFTSDPEPVPEDGVLIVFSIIATIILLIIYFYKATRLLSPK